jgi:xylose dehydrogenase (NAD/NADP)
MNERIRWGILGCARISRRGLIPGILGSAGSQLFGLASRDAEKARAWCAEFGIAKSYGSYEALLADRDVEAVYIPLPNELHHEWTIRAAEAGKHVLCDKPLAINAREAEEMSAACRRAKVLLMEGFMWRHQPRTGQVQAIVRRGDIGHLRLIRCSFSFDIDRSDWRLDPSRGGGALWDVGCYGVNTCRLFGEGEPAKIQSLAHWGPTNTDMTLAATLEFSGGVLGQVDCSFEMPYRCRYELVGTKGIIEVPLAYLPGESPTIVVHRGGSTETIATVPANQYTRMVDHFGAAVRSGDSLAAPAEDGVANMRVLDAVAAMARANSV